MPKLLDDFRELIRVFTIFYKILKFVIQIILFIVNLSFFGSLKWIALVLGIDFWIGIIFRRIIKMRPISQLQGKKLNYKG